MNEQRLLVVVPALNEAESITRVVDALRSHAYDVLVVDDGSTDDTAARASQRGATVLSLALNLGVGGALRAGFRYAVEHGYSAVAQVDADGQHPPHQVRDLLDAALQHDAHLTIGSRYLSLDSTFSPSASRRLAMRVLGWLASRAAGRTITDSTSGFRVIREPLLSEFARDFPSYYLGDTFEVTVAAARAGYTITEVPAALSPREHGQSSSGTARSTMLIAKVLLITALRFHPPLRALERVS